MARTPSAAVVPASPLAPRRSPAQPHAMQRHAPRPARVHAAAALLNLLLLLITVVMASFTNITLSNPLDSL